MLGVWSTAFALIPATLVLWWRQVTALADPLAVPNLPRLQDTFTNQGFVSLILVSSSNTRKLIIAGTKRGNLEMFQWEPSSESWIHKGPIKQQNSDGMSKIPYPIYSLNFRKASSQIFCAGGDRYITVWEEQKNDAGISTAEWNVVQKLGPHTGWVKSLALDDASGGVLLHSIGCNCIESWGQNNDNSGGEWKHLKKRFIESSPELGTTLSSDLLCLELWENCLLSGGVDGRIHLWPSNPSGSAQPWQSISAHDGRVNALLIVPCPCNMQLGEIQHGDSTACLVFSVGHDGVLQCRKLRRMASTHNIPLLIESPIGSFVVQDEQGSAVRITSLACSRMNDKFTELRVLLGTTSGLLIEVDVIGDEVMAWNSCQMKEQTRLELGTDTTINAIITTRKAATYAIVGHSNGLSTVCLGPFWWSDSSFRIN